MSGVHVVKVLVVPPTGVVAGLTEIEPTLEAIGEIVGGHVTLVALGGRGQMYCNEDGLDLELPVNRRATAMLRLFGGGQLLAGTVVFLGGDPDRMQDTPQEVQDAFNGVDVMLGPGG